MTLDPKTRQLFIPGVGKTVLTDTVGFIRDLPSALISAFKATLEEAQEADALLHVTDASHPYMQRHIQTVNTLTETFGWNDKPKIHVLNKIDLAPSGKAVAPKNLLGPRVCVSAKTGQGLKDLLRKMKDTVENLTETAEIFFPKGEEHKILNFSSKIRLLKKEAVSTGTLCRVQIPARQKTQWKKYLLS